jgi:Glycosyl-4,4'-diaponeurosporenoate acyltransferase
LRPSGLRRIVNYAVMAGFVVGATAWTLEMSRPSVLFALGINWALMGLAFAVWLTYPVRFGRSYYRVHAFERSGRLYERLGVRLFQRFLRRSGLGWLRYRPGPGASTNLVAATEGSETSHLLIFIVLAAVSGMFVRRGWWDTAGWLMVFNVVHNAYPVLSLRYVRARAKRLFEFSSEKAESIDRYCSGVVGETLAAQQAAAADERRGKHWVVEAD